MAARSSRPAGTRATRLACPRASADCDRQRMAGRRTAPARARRVAQPAGVRQATSSRRARMRSPRAGRFERTPCTCSTPSVTRPAAAAPSWPPWAGQKEQECTDEERDCKERYEHDGAPHLCKRHSDKSRHLSTRCGVRAPARLQICRVNYGPRGDRRIGDDGALSDPARFTARGIDDDLGEWSHDWEPQDACDERPSDVHVLERSRDRFDAGGCVGAIARFVGDSGQCARWMMFSRHNLVPVHAAA